MEIHIKLKINSIKFNIFFVILFIHTCFIEWLQETILFSVGPINVYIIDLIYVLLVYVSARVLLSKKRSIIFKEGPLYGIFLLWIFVEILVGLTRYGFRAIGEARYVIPFLSFFVPFYLLNAKQRSDPEYISALVYKTFFWCALASIFAYVFNFIIGNENMFLDFRGVRYIGSLHTFYLTILFCFYTLKYAVLKSIKINELLLLIVCIALAILSKNRAGLIFPIAMASLVYAKHFSIKKIIYSVLIVIALLLSLKFFIPSGLLNEIDLALSGALDPTTDQTGKWRLAVQASAFLQSLETFWFGQGYGGYFNFSVPGMNWNLPVEYPPHNQYLSFFLKAGIFGAILCLATVLNYTYKSLKIMKYMDGSSRNYLFIVLLMITISSQLLYGLVYDFIQTYGLYYGFGVLLMNAVYNKKVQRNKLVSVIPEVSVKSVVI